MKNAVWSLTALLAIGCQAPGPSGGALVGGDLFIPAASPISAHREAVTSGDGPNGAHIIFLNFDGAAIKSGSQSGDDSATNTSQIASSSVQYPAFDDSPYTGGSGGLTRTQVIMGITNQFKQYYAPFNVETVTTRPAAGVRYEMCMIGGTPDLVLGGQGGGAAGVAPLDCGNQVEENIVYAFSDVVAPNMSGLSATDAEKAVAITCAQETAHGYGLGHTTNQMDVMYPQLGDLVTGFGGLSNLQNDGSGVCSGQNATQQDSAAMLKMVIGASSGNPNTGPSPVVAFVTPTEGSTVPLSFTIKVAASETGGTISKVEITSQGQSVGLTAVTAPPYQWNVMAPSAGMFQLTATATDSAGNFQSATVNFTASASAPPQMTGCQTDGDCNAPLVCVSGQCDMPGSSSMPTGGCSDQNPCGAGMACQPDGSCAPSSSSGPSPGSIGSSCASSNDCGSGICATHGNKSFCTASCDPGNKTSCPANFGCASAGGGSYVCQPSNHESGGCSAVPGAAPTGDGILLLCFGLLGALAFRKRSFI